MITSKEKVSKSKGINRTITSEITNEDDTVPSNRAVSPLLLEVFKEKEELTDKIIGYFTWGKEYQENKNYETLFFSIEDIIDTHYIIGPQIGSGFIDYGFSSAIGTSADIIISQVNSGSVGVNRIINKVNIPKEAKYIFLTNRIGYDRYLYYTNTESIGNVSKNCNNIDQIKNQVEVLGEECDNIKNLILDDNAFINLNPDSTIKGYLNWDLSYSSHTSIITNFYKINRNALSYKVSGEYLGSGFIDYAFCKDISTEADNIISKLNATTTIHDHTIKLSDIPKEANYIAITTAVGYSRALFVNLGLPQYNYHKLQSLNNFSNNYKYRVRVVSKTDNVVSKEGTDNNVNRTFNLLQVIRKYNDNYDLMICMGLNGPNGMFGIRGWKLIPNTKYEIAEFPQDNSFNEMMETIGPWKISDSSITSSSPFVGGFHGFSGEDRDYPSARNLGFEYFADGKKLSLGDDVMANAVMAKSTVNICAGNTYNSDSHEATEALQYIDTYLFKDDKIYLFAEFEALIDLSIELHYGLQTDRFNPYLTFITDSGIKVVDTSVITSGGENVPGKPIALFGKKSDGNLLIAKMYETGAFSGERNEDVKFFASIYGANNGKQYHWVYGNGKVGNMKKGDKNFYSGYFCMTDKIIADLLI